jgi:hypothetical protein
MESNKIFDWRGYWGVRKENWFDYKIGHWCYLCEKMDGIMDKSWWILGPEHDEIL